MNNFVLELRWRGMIHDMTPGTEKLVNDEKVTGYIGFDPTADSLHVGSLVQIMTLVHLQRSGHTPIAVLGGATGMVGDPSGKSKERNLLDKEALDYNLNSIKDQLSKFLDFESGNNKAIMLNNYDWMKDFSFLEFIRDIGKHITVNYMMAKDSVKNRIGEGTEGMSFTEFSYQLIQGYDFLHLFQNHGCKLQLGGSDQWGNIVTGTELIKRKFGDHAYAVTTPLVKKADGTKFGKTEDGNVWLDPKKTSPYKFYQFWLNTSDEDAETYIKIFTLKDEKEIETLITEHNEEPHTRILQRALAEDITERVHSEEALEKAVAASKILFGNSTTEDLQNLDEATLLDIFGGVPQVTVEKDKLISNVPAVDLLTEITENVIFNSKGEARRMIEGGGVQINKNKLEEAAEKANFSFLQDKYLLIQKGKKNYFLIIAN